MNRRNVPCLRALPSPAAAAWRLSLLCWMVSLAGLPAAQTTLWPIGRNDTDNVGFALAGVESAPVANPAARARPASAPSPEAGPPLREIVIVYKTHFDIGYTQLARDVCHQYRTEMADKVLRGHRAQRQSAEREAVRLDALRLSDEPDSRAGTGARPPRENLPRHPLRQPRRPRARASPCTTRPSSRRTWSARWAGRPPSPASTGCRCRATPRPPTCPAIRGFCPPCSRTPG